MLDAIAILKRWDHGHKTGHRVRYDQGKEDIEALVDEVRRLQKIEEEKRSAEARAQETEKRFRNMQNQMIAEIERVVRKYDPI